MYLNFSEKLCRLFFLNLKNYSGKIVIKRQCVPQTFDGQRITGISVKCGQLKNSSPIYYPVDGRKSDLRKRGIDFI